MCERKEPSVAAAVHLRHLWVLCLRLSGADSSHILNLFKILSRKKKMQKSSGRPLQGFNRPALGNSVHLDEIELFFLYNLLCQQGSHFNSFCWKERRGCIWLEKLEAVRKRGQTLQVGV